MMDLKDLQYFLAVAQAGTITGAAAKLCMAQPPLSRQMKELEEELGTTLFIRGKRHIRLTEEGIFLRQQAEEILSLMEKTRGQLSRMGTGAGGLISIGVTESCGAGVLSDIIERFHSDFPGIRYNIWCGNGDEINDKLDKGLVDLGIVREPFRTEKYESALIKTESWTALLSREHPMADYLKFKSWYLEYPVSNPVVEDTEQFLELAVDIFLKMKPFNDYLNQALEGFKMPER